MVTVSELESVGRAVAAEFSEKNVTFLAGSIAYDAFVSLVPILLFLVLALALLGAGWEDRFLALVSRNVSPTIGRFIRQIFRGQVGGAAGSSLVGFLVLVWGALKLFRGLDTAFEEIYEVDADSSIVDQFRDGIVVLLSLVLSVVAIVAATSAFGAFAGVVPYLGLLLPAVLAAGLVVAFAPMYYVFPNVDVTVGEIMPGVLVSAVGWALLQGLFQVYVAVSTGNGPTSLVTGVMLLLTWLYFSGVVLLLGVVVNAVLGGHVDREGSPAGTGATA
jgi:membrane protein